MRMPVTELLNPNEIVVDKPSADPMHSVATSEKGFTQIKIVSPTSIMLKPEKGEIVLSSQNTSVKGETN